MCAAAGDKMAECATHKYIIHACYNLQTEIIFLNELSFEKFMDECVKVFKMPSDSQKIVKITTNSKAILTPNTFNSIVEHFNKCACFCLDIKIAASKDDADMITSKALESFLIDANATAILHENETTGGLSEKSRKSLIKHLHEYLIESFGDSPSQSQKVAVAKATIHLFPSLKVLDSSVGGIDLLINSTNGGYLGLKEKNSRRSTKKKDDDTENQSSVEDDLKFLKSVVVNPQSKETIEKKLKSTLTYRKQMVRNVETDLLEQFPFFFSNPELILVDYDLHFQHAIEHAGALVDNWESYAESLNEMLTKKYSSHIYTQWSKDIQDILVLLKLLPVKNNLKASTNLESFNKATEKMFLFRKTGTPRENMIDKSNKAPYIIACGESKDKIDQFFIDVDKQLIGIPLEYSAVQTFDIFFKAHKVFDLVYEANIAAAMRFVEHFVYKLPKKTYRPSLRMIEMSNFLLQRTPAA